MKQLAGQNGLTRHVGMLAAALLVAVAACLSGCASSNSKQEASESASNKAQQAQQDSAQQTESEPAAAESATNEGEGASMSSATITIGDATYTMTFEQNETAAAFAQMLPLECTMSELNGNEKYYYLPQSLPTNSEAVGRVEAGDVMLFGQDCLVVFYEGFNTGYSYTPIGHIDAPSGLADALGSGNANVSFTL